MTKHHGAAIPTPKDDPVPHAVFRVDGVPTHERFDLWRESIACVFEVEANKTVRSNGFQAEIDANMFGSVMLARTQTLEQRWERSPRLMAKDGMDHYMIQLYEKGDMLWETDSGPMSFPKDGLVVFDLAQPMVSKTNNFANISLFIPRLMLEDQLKSAGDQHLRVLTGREPMVQLLRDHMISLKKLSSRITARQAVEIAPATVGLAAACLNAAISPDSPHQASGIVFAQITKARRFVEANITNPNLSVEAICIEVGVSRSKLYELFESFGGIARYVRERRLRRALLALTDATTCHHSIYDIALASGYTNDAAFVRAFRRRYGLTPKDVRRMGAARAAARVEHEGVDRRHEDWVRHLAV
jgi:AraC-like DNA-binding protein